MLFAIVVLPRSSPGFSVARVTEPILYEGLIFPRVELTGPAVYPGQCKNYEMAMGEQLLRWGKVKPPIRGRFADGLAANATKAA